MKKNKKNKQIMIGIVLLFVLCVVFVLVYKAQLRDRLDKHIYGTLMSEHKANGTIDLSADAPVVSEAFLCSVPKLKQLRIQCKGEQIDPDAVLVMTLSEADSGKEYYHKEIQLPKLISEGKSKMVVMKFKKALSDAEGKRLILSWELIDAGTTKLQITANSKPGMVISCNGIQEDKRNIIYAWKYSNAKELKSLYVALCIALLLFGGICYWLIIIRQLPAERFYLPVAICLGMIFQAVIAVHGVPDEPWHIDTAYKYSNKMLFVEDTGVPGTIYKRQCDALMQDLLANGVESNSYYQLMHHTFEWADDKELIQVNYVDSSNLVPGVIFFPTALGISIGRLLGLSALLTLQLGRLCNLLAFVLLTWGAIRTTPYAKNLIAMIGLLPITMQQGASASYDAVTNGLAFLFIAYCFRLAEAEQRKKRQWVLLLVLAALLVMIKGGVYSPMLLLLILLFKKNNLKNKIKKENYKKLLFIIVMGILIFAALIMKYLPMFIAFIGNGEAVSGENSLYTVKNLTGQPLQIVYLYWNSLMNKGDNYVGELLGRRLSWLDIKVNWTFLLILFIGLVLLANVTEETYRITKKQRLIMVAISCISIVLIMLSMLFGHTVVGKNSIAGVQGRYFLALSPLLFLLASTDMVNVKKEQCRRIWMTMMVTEILIVLQVVVAVM